MAADPSLRPADATMDAASLYREEIYTDRKVGTLRVLVPVQADGSAEATKGGVERAMRELQEMRRQASSSIVIPQAGAGGLPPGGLGGGGKIQLP